MVEYPGAGRRRPEGTYLTDYLTDRVIDLLEQRDERPFFLNLWYYAVHTPIQAKEDKIASYEAIYVVTPKDGRWGIQARSSFAP